MDDTVDGPYIDASSLNYEGKEVGDKLNKLQYTGRKLDALSSTGVKEDRSWRDVCLWGQWDAAHAVQNL